MRAVVLLAVVTSQFLAAATPTPRLHPAFEHFYNLEYDEAVVAFERAAAEQPANPTPYNSLAQTLLFREMWRAGALESELVSGGNSFLRRPKMNASPESAKRFNDAIAKAMQLSQSRLDANPNDIEALYAKGVAHGLQGNYDFLVKKARSDALKQATAGRKLHNRISELDPEHVDARLMQGMHDYIVGSLPWHVRMVGFLAGIRGDREKGIETLRMVAGKGNQNLYDAKILLAVIYRRERRAQDAIPLLRSMVERFPRNYLFRLELALMHSEAGDKAEALAVLQQVEELKKSGASGFASLPVEKIFFYRGNVFFWEKDWEPALANLQRVTPRVSDLDLNTGVMAWMRLGQIYDMTGRRSEAVNAYKQAIAVAPQSEAAKESRGYLSSPYKRS